MQCPVWLFSVVPSFRAFPFRYYLNDYEMVPVVLIITGITLLLHSIIITFKNETMQ